MEIFYTLIYVIAMTVSGTEVGIGTVEGGYFKKAADCWTSGGEIARYMRSNSKSLSIHVICMPKRPDSYQDEVT